MTDPSPAADPRHIAVAFAVAASFARRFPRLADEFESECLVALCEAAASFDPGRGVKFSTYAGHRIKGAMLDVLRHWTACGFRRGAAPAPSVGSLDAPTATGEAGGPAIPSESLPADEGPVGWEEEYQDELRGLARRVTRGTGEAIVLLYGHAGTATMKGVGASLDLSESRISQMHAAGIADLSDRFGGHTPGEVFMHGTARFTRDELLRGVTMGGYEDDGATAGAAGVATTIAPPARAPTDGHAGATPAAVDAPSRSCPDCGRPYGKRARCYSCRPGKPGGVEIARRASAREKEARGRRAVPPANPTEVLRKEFDAAMAVAEALDGLDAASTTRVLARVTALFAEGGGA